MSESIQIKKAIQHFNENRKEGVERMTQGKLAALVMPEESKALQNSYMSLWSLGKRLTALSMERLKAICKHTGVDANFLLDIEPMKSNQ